MQVQAINNLYQRQIKHYENNNKNVINENMNNQYANPNLTQILRTQTLANINFGEHQINPGLEFYCKIRDFEFCDEDNSFYHDENNLVNYFYDNLKKIKPHINMVSPRSGNTILHLCAMYDLHKLTDAVLNNCDVDLTIQNRHNISVLDILKQKDPVALEIYELKHDDTVSSNIKSKINRDNVYAVKTMLNKNANADEILSRIKEIEEKQFEDDSNNVAEAWALSHSERSPFWDFFKPWSR